MGENVIVVQSSRTVVECSLMLFAIENVLKLKLC